MEHIDTIVIGAGLAGAAVAARLDGSVVLLEQGRQPGAEATAQNAGMVRLLVEDPVERRLALRAQELLEGLDDAWEQPPSTITGAVHGLIHEPDELDDAVASLRAAGVEVHPTTELPPALDGAPLRRAWSVPGARVADPHALLTGLLRERTVRCDVAVHGLRLSGGRIAGLSTSHGELSCDRVVLAAGAWSGALVASLGLRRPLHPIRRSLLQSAPHPLSSPTHPWCWLEDLGLYIRPEGGGWLVSGCDERIDPPAPGPGSTGAVDPTWRETVSERLLQLLPALSDLRWRGGWTGLRTFAPDRRPLLGPDPEVPGLSWAAGLGGFGVTTHLAVGEAVAAWMDGRDVPWLLQAEVDPGRDFPRRWVIRPQGTRRGMQLVPG
ncbi:MAG: FAD-binding oxidoreductase [Alphaproteobacteria bacterium]|nr:FAD-binding oxidoreductase [Alphaproteobacteria bacterium]